MERKSVYRLGALFLVLFSLLALALYLAIAPEAKAQTVYSLQDNSLRTGITATGGVQLNAVSCTAAVATRSTGCMYVEKMRALALDVDFVDAGSTAADLEVKCYETTDSTCATGLRQLPINTSCTASGLCTYVPYTAQFLSTTGGAPGTFSAPLVMSTIVGPYMQCVATCGAGAVAGATITINARGITP